MFLARFQTGFLDLDQRLDAMHRLIFNPLQRPLSPPSTNLVTETNRRAH